ncbi:MAG: fluoride efflux transporter CrcB [Granulosicoccaceae bacterium]
MSPVTGLISVAAGGALGAGARYLLGIWLVGEANRISWAVLSANVLGCFMAGFMAALISHRVELSPAMQLFLGTGVLGGFTTFSAFSVNTLAIAESGDTILAAGNVALNVVGSLVAVVVGWSIARMI